MLGWRAYEAGRCGRCGVHRSEWPTGPDDDEAFFAEPERCPYCAMVDEVSREIPDQVGARDGVGIRLRPFDEDAFQQAEIDRERRRQIAQGHETQGLLEGGPGGS